MAVVGLEKTFYQVSEDAGVLEVCIIVYDNIPCPIKIAFDVSLSSSNRFTMSHGSAGNGH